ncbi:MAG: 50S ribosomal protein L25/general stress protein Ctc, partial [Alphaproteobacteria bacterium]
NISDANMPDGVEPVINDRDFTVATLVEPKAADEPEPEDVDADAAAEGEEGAEATAEGDASEE